MGSMTSRILSRIRRESNSGPRRSRRMLEKFDREFYVRPALGEVLPCGTLVAGPVAAAVLALRYPEDILRKMAEAHRHRVLRCGVQLSGAVRSRRAGIQGSAADRSRPGCERRASSAEYAPLCDLLFRHSACGGARGELQSFRRT